MAWFDDQVAQIAQSPAAAGAAGSVLSLFFVPGDSWKMKVGNLLGGMCVVVWGVPAAIEFFNITNKAMPPLFGLLAGLLGMALINRAVEYVRTTPFGELIASWMPKGKQP